MGKYFNNERLNNLWANILLSVIQQYVPEGETLEGTGFKHVHDALMAYTGLTRENEPVSLADYLVGISRCAQYISGETTFSEISLDEISRLLGVVTLFQPNIVFRANPDIIFSSFGAMYSAFELYVDGEYFLTFEGYQLELEPLELGYGNHTLQLVGISKIIPDLRSPISDPIEYYSIKLIKPDISIDGDILTVHNINQQEVDAGVFYLIRQIKNNISVSTGLTFSPPQNTYDLSELKLSPGTYTIQLEAIIEANGRYYKSSFANNQDYIILLDGVPRLSIRNKTITIDSNAQKFNIYIDNVKRVVGGATKVFNAVTYLGRVFNLPVGEYSITVKAVVNDVESQASNAVIYKVELSDEPVPSAPITEYRGYTENSNGSHTYKFYNQINDVAYKIKVKVNKTIEEEKDDISLWTYPVRNEFWYNVRLNTNGPYEYSFAIANRFGVYGPYSEPITIDVTLGTEYPPDPPLLTIEDIDGSYDTDVLNIAADGAATGLKLWANDRLILDKVYSSSFLTRHIGPLSPFLKNKGLSDGEYTLTAKTRNYLGYWGERGGDLLYSVSDLYEITLDEDGVAEYKAIKNNIRVGEEATFTLFKLTSDGETKIAQHLVRGTRCNLAEYISGGTYLVKCDIKISKYTNTSYTSDAVSFNKSLIGNNLIENVYIDNNPVRLMTPIPGATYTLLIEGNEICSATADQAGNLYFYDDVSGVYFVHSPNRGWYFSIHSNIKSAVVSVRADFGAGVNPLIDSKRVRFTFTEEDGKYIARITTPAASNKPFSYYYLLHYNTAQLLDERFTKDTVVDFTDVITNHPYAINDLYLYLYAYLDEDPDKFYSCSFKVLYL